MTSWMMARRPLSLLLTAAIALSTIGCEDTKPAPSATRTASAAASETVPAAHTATARAPSAPPPEPEPGAAVDEAFSRKEYAALVKRLSEPEGDFFSDNFISNETSYLQPTKLLESRPKGGVYIGVGPEQNFTYLALTEPELAFIVDIRRDNLVLHLFYKAAFDLARSRSHFLALLTGAEYEGSGDPGAEGTIEEVLAHVDEGRAEEAKPRAAAQKRIYRKLLEKVEKGYGIDLSAKDEQSLERAHRAFAKDGLDIRFELKENSTRKYPSLRELLSATDPDGEQRSFIASEQAFRSVQRMQRENRVIPVVGDFAGEEALAAVAELVEEEGKTVRHFYTSNVEQYLLVEGKWWKWQRNVKALPIDGDSAFIRGYLDQGKAHPNQMSGHRTATILQPMKAFVEREGGYRSMWALCTDGVM